MSELMSMTDPEVERKYISYDDRDRAALFLLQEKSIYGLLNSDLIFYFNLWGDLKHIGFRINPHGPCVGNDTVKGS